MASPSPAEKEFAMFPSATAPLAPVRAHSNDPDDTDTPDIPAEPETPGEENPPGLPELPDPTEVGEDG